METIVFLFVLVLVCGAAAGVVQGRAVKGHFKHQRDMMKKIEENTRNSKDNQ